ncbi:hypothetical protein TcYC6_0116680 [Trypanosoma cruzi]|nr:hypothetical protein TcYC6_0116680 [Trypanosoma cruzi]
MGRKDVVQLLCEKMELGPLAVQVTSSCLVDAILNAARGAKRRQLLLYGIMASTGRIPKAKLPSNCILLELTVETWGVGVRTVVMFTVPTDTPPQKRRIFFFFFFLEEGRCNQFVAQCRRFHDDKEVRPPRRRNSPGDDTPMGSTPVEFRCPACGFWRHSGDGLAHRRTARHGGRPDIVRTGPHEQREETILHLLRCPALRAPGIKMDWTLKRRGSRASRKSWRGFSLKWNGSAANSAFTRRGGATPLTDAA